MCQPLLTKENHRQTDPPQNPLQSAKIVMRPTKPEFIS